MLTQKAVNHCTLSLKMGTLVGSNTKDGFLNIILRKKKQWLTRAKSFL